MQIGTSFDPEQAIHLGLNSIDTLQNILSLGLSPIRIGLKWNAIEEKENIFNWKTTDILLEKISKNGTKSIITIGMKSPRWPEFYIPEWVLSSSRSVSFQSNTFFQNKLANFINKSIERYKELPFLETIQIENEPFTHFGVLNTEVTENSLKKEIALAKNLTGLPILLTTPGLPTTGLIPELITGAYTKKKRLIEMSDGIGFNIFPRIPLWNRFYYKASPCAWLYLKHFIDKSKSLSKKVYITELQAEPWEKTNWNFTDPHGNKSTEPDMLTSYVHRLASYGIETSLLWGSEFHIACLKHGNNAWITRVEAMINDQRQ